MAVKCQPCTVGSDQKVIQLSNIHQLGYINSRNGEIGEEVVISSDHEGITVGEYKDFVVTSLKQGATYQIHIFVTYPEDRTELSFPFHPQTRRSHLSASLTGMVAAMSALYVAQTPEATAVIEVKITGEIKIDDEISVLPIKMINIQVHSNGALSFYGDKDDDNEAQKED